jgi:hypothetical protein
VNSNSSLPRTPATSAYRQSVEDVAESLGARVRDGLSDDDARAKLERDGPNELEAEKPVPAWRRFLAQFQDVLVILLLVATTVSAVLWVYERETALPYEALRDPRRRAAQRDDRLSPGVARRSRRGGAARHVRAPTRPSSAAESDGACRRRSCRATSSSSRKATRSPPMRG